MNTQGVFAGRQDTPLTDRGRAQAREAANSLKSIHVSAIVCSNLSRAAETAEIIAQAINYPTNQIIVDERFTEQTYGTLEGKPWTTTDWSTFSGIETDEELIIRARQALDYLHTLDADTVLLVSHGSFSRALQAAIHGGAMPTDEPANAKVTQFI